MFRNYPQYFTWKERLYFKPLRWTAPKADRIITTTEYVKKELIQLCYVNISQPADLAPSGITSIFKPINQQDPAFLKKVKEKYKTLIFNP